MFIHVNVFKYPFPDSKWWDGYHHQMFIVNSFHWHLFINGDILSMTV